MKNNKLAKWFVLWLTGMVVLIILTQPAERPDPLDDPHFDISESAQLYFKNMRSFYYITTQDGGGMFQVYMLKSTAEDKSACNLRFNIYENWRSNEAFIRLDASPGIDNQIYRLIIQRPNGNFDYLDLPSPHNDSQLIFARDLYRILSSDFVSVKLNTAQGNCDVSAQALNSCKSTLRDYFKLTGAL